MLGTGRERDPCPECGDRGWVIQGGVGGTAFRCACRKRRQIPLLLRQAAIPRRYESCRLRTFHATGDQGAREQLLKAQAECRRYVETFLTPEGRFRESGLLFIGPPGVGKTHLAVALLVELIESYGVKGRFIDFTSFNHEVQSTFGAQSSTSTKSILSPIQNAELLVLDELGAQKPTPWVSDLLYLIMNTRYANRRPTLFTSNFRLDSLPPASGMPEVQQQVLLRHRIPEMLVSRLYEMTKPVYLDVVGDYRREIQMHQHQV